MTGYHHHHANTNNMHEVLSCMKILLQHLEYDQPPLADIALYLKILLLWYNAVSGSTYDN